MIEKIRTNLFRIEIPLPDSPLKYLNAYVVQSAERNLVIDTGLNHPECRKAMLSGLKTLCIDLRDTDFFITHLHADHFGLISDLATESSRVFFNRPDAEIVESWDGFDWMIGYAAIHGFSKQKLQKVLKTHPARKFGSHWLPEFNIIENGEVLTYGDYRFTTLHTPGHTLGHTCLYDSEKKILVAGDHILMDISPNIQCWSDEQNPLKSYLQSLRKVYDLDVALVLPGHRRMFRDHRSRIQDLLHHHETRLGQIGDILSRRPRNAYETAKRMDWDLKASHWDEFPVAQQWFATSEALAHLRFLEEQRCVERILIDGVVEFRLIDPKFNMIG
jgi:glyoxylase-like metal-dependent hydrolase (beta-lactamase superfamily II)